MKEQSQRNYDHCHVVKALDPLHPGQSVWIPDRSEEAQVLNKAGPRSYEVLTHDGGVYSRNRRALVELPDSNTVNEDTTYTTGSDVVMASNTTDQVNTNKLETTADTTQDD